MVLSTHNTFIITLNYFQKCVSSSKSYVIKNICLLGAYAGNELLAVSDILVKFP